MKQNEKQFQLFLKALTGLNPLEFIGVARVMGVKVMVDKDTPRQAEDILADMMIKFPQLSRTARRNLMRILRQATEPNVES